ncbi:MAG: FHA domain-containing protein [Burkholderiales bacterium]|nr:FHA domain-containing protein [Burkholderiales bacterium]
MAKLVVTSPAGGESHYFVDKDRLTIGRDAACDIALADAAASKEHAVIVTVGLDHVLQDTGSRNGTAVNGKPIGTHVLQNEDLIEIGESRIRYRNRRASLEADLERTMIYNATLPGGASTSAAGVARSVEPPAGAGTRDESSASASVARTARARFPLGAVRALAGRLAGTELTLGRPLATFGTRAAGLAVIRRRPHGYFVAHVAGAARPKVNGTVVAAEPRALAPGDVIEIGGERLEFLRAG